jgi:hypothetical protein
MVLLDGVSFQVKVGDISNWHNVNELIFSNVKEKIIAL